MDAAHAITQPGRSETFKAGVHLGLFGLAAICLAYNLAAASERPSRHLAFNVAVYGGLVFLEGYHVIGHVSAETERRTGWKDTQIPARRRSWPPSLR